MSSLAPDATAHIPVLEDDLFADEAILDPYSCYRRMRDLGPVVQLPAQGVLAVGRYADVRRVLADHETFVSGHGVFWNDVANELTRGTVLASDPPEHGHLRQLVAGQLTPRALRNRQAEITAVAEGIVTDVLGKGTVIDAVTDLAQAMPSAVIPNFLGFPADARPHLLTWAKGATEAAGPFTSRTAAAVPVAQSLGRYAEELVAERRALPDSLGSALLAAADRGEVAVDRCPALMLDYFGPSMETTLSAIGNAIALFATHPDQWQLLRAQPELAANTFNEVVRLESPLRAFTRVAAQDTDIDGVPVPSGSRIAVFYASANRDERKWSDAETFDITRDCADQLGLGYGEHGCAGQGLARLEMTALLTTLARSVQRIEPAGTPIVSMASIVRSYAILPVRLVPA